jgi:hypothetical protein
MQYFDQDLKVAEISAPFHTLRKRVEGDAKAALKLSREQVAQVELTTKEQVARVERAVKERSATASQHVQALAILVDALKQIMLTQTQTTTTASSSGGGGNTACGRGDSWGVVGCSAGGLQVGPAAGVGLGKCEAGLRYSTDRRHGGGLSGGGGGGGGDFGVSTLCHKASEVSQELVQRVISDMANTVDSLNGLLQSVAQAGAASGVAEDGSRSRLGPYTVRVCMSHFNCI